MNTQRRPTKAILTATVAAIFLLTACGSDENTALEPAGEVPAAEDSAPTAVPEEAAPPEETQEVPAAEETAPTAVPEEAAPPEETQEAPAAEEAVAEFTAAFGNDDADLAWSFVSERCRGGISEAPDGYRDAVAGWAARFPGATASNITAVVDGDRAAMSYDVYDGAGDFAEKYIAQPWALSDGDWFRDGC